jgi:hypothetical protein
VSGWLQGSPHFTTGWARATWCSMEKIRDKVKRGAKKVRRSTRWAKQELADRQILDMAAVPYAQVKERINNYRKDPVSALGSDQRMALQMGAKILQKVKDVRTSLIKKSPKANDSE